MSDSKELSLLDKIKQQHQMYCQQRDQAHINFQQLSGAIHVLESVIKSHEDEAQKIQESGEQEHVQVDQQEPCELAQE